MTARFVGQVTGDAVSYVSLEPPARLAGQQSLTVIADGFITNVRELRAEAAKRAEQAATSVAGWIGLAYRWWGTEASRYVLGQYSASVINHSDRSVTLVQDSLGVRPVFYRSSHDGIAFANNLIDLVSLTRPSELDVEYFADVLATAVTSTARTPYASIRRLTFGGSVTWREGRLDLRRPWSPSMIEELRQLDASEYATELCSRLSSAVDAAVPDGERVWCELSGGLDSTSVLAVGLLAGHPLEAFTFVSTDRDDWGDTAAATEAATALQVPWHTLEAAETPPFSTVPTDFRAEPGTELYVIRQAAYDALLREQGVSVVLTGTGGDAAFGGPDCMPHHLADSLVRCRPLLLWRALRSWQCKDPRQRSMLFWFWQCSLRTAARHASRSYLHADSPRRPPTWLAQDFARRHHIRRRARAQEFPRHPLPGRQALWQEIYGRAAALGVTTATDEVDFRHPLLDRRLVEFMLAIPYEQRQQADCDRYLQRRALRHVLPGNVLERHSKGTGQLTFDHGLRVSKPWLTMLTDGPRIVTAGFVELEAWRAEVERARFGVYESLPHFATAACTECWLRRYEQGLPEPIRLEAQTIDATPSHASSSPSD